MSKRLEGGEGTGSDSVTEASQEVGELPEGCIVRLPWNETPRVRFSMRYPWRDEYTILLLVDWTMNCTRSRQGRGEARVWRGYPGEGGFGTDGKSGRHGYLYAPLRVEP